MLGRWGEGGVGCGVVVRKRRGEQVVYDGVGWGEEMVCDWRVEGWGWELMLYFRSSGVGVGEEVVCDSGSGWGGEM